jgi:hypothetical protein
LPDRPGDGRQHVARMSAATCGLAREVNPDIASLIRATLAAKAYALVVRLPAVVRSISVE